MSLQPEHMDLNPSNTADITELQACLTLCCKDLIYSVLHLISEVEKSANITLFRLLVVILT